MLARPLLFSAAGLIIIMEFYLMLRPSGPEPTTEDTMSRKSKTSLFRLVRRMPGDIMSKNPERRKNGCVTLMIVLLVIAIALMGVYAAVWYIERSRIIGDSRRYQEMYASRAETPSPSPAATKAPSPSPTPTAAPGTEAGPALSPVIDADAQTAQSPEAPEDTAPVPSDIPVSEGTVAPLATPNENTLVYALPTAPPVQSAFDELLSLNGDTVGFLEIGDVIALPVVQRTNDNAYYLTHNFENNESSEGALFLDGSNLLVPEDDCLIVYGHNMKNDTMFGRLESYADMTFLKKHAIVRFDTLYENRSYVPFAAFTASMDKDSSRYFDVRQFVFDETSFELFTLKMQTRSIYEIPVDVCWGDRILLLVTCDYTNTEGRFILCLRQLREDESEDALWAAVQKVQAN